MSEPFVLHEPLPSLDRPVLVVMMHGWIDAANAAAGAMAALDLASDLRTIVTFDSDTFVDYRARRPVMELREGVNTRLVWADIVMKAGHAPNGAPIVTLTGPEPDMNWKRFAAAVTELAGRLGVRAMVALGAYPFATPHTRPVLLSVTSPSAELVDGLPYVRSTLDAPAGVAAALEHSLHSVGIPAMGLWAQVPHYVSALGYPRSSVALLEALRPIAGVIVDTASLIAEAGVQEARIDQLVQANGEHIDMVRQMEAAFDASVADRTPDLPPLGDLPSADELAAEFERFLRDQQD